MSKITLSFMERFINNLDTAIKNYVSTKTEGYAKSSTRLTQTLNAGDTEVVFVNNAISSDKYIDVYTSVAGLNYDEITVSGNTLTLTFEAQESNITVILDIKE